MNELKVLSLFSGIGAFEKALTNLNIDFELVGFSEINKYAINSYCAVHNIDESKNLGDVTKIDETTLDDFDLLVGGFPCQSFSISGKRLGFKDTRGTLFFELARIASVKKPKMILLENVKGLVSHDKGKTLDTIVQTLCDMGYTVDFNVLNSKYFGVPQNRERIFIIAIRDDLITPEPWHIEGTNVVAKGKRRISQIDGIKTFNFDWPAQDKVTARLRDILESDVDERYYLSEEKTAKLVAELEERQLTDDTKIIQQNQAPKVLEPQMLGHIDIKGHDALKRVYSPEGISPTLTTMGGGNTEPKIAVEQYSSGNGLSYCLDANYAKGTAPGDVGKGRRTHVIEEVLPVITPDRINKRQNGRRFKGNDEEAFTPTAQDRHSVAIKYGVVLGDEYPIKYNGKQYRIRKLTPLECWRLMGFDDEDYHKAEEQCSNTQLYKQAGNSIVVNVVQALLHNLLNR